MKKIYVSVLALILFISLSLLYTKAFVDADGTCDVQCSIGAESVLFVDNVGPSLPEGGDVYAGFFEYKDHIGMDFGETYTGIKFNLATLRSNSAPVTKATLELFNVRTELLRENYETVDTHGKINIHIHGTNYDNWAIGNMSRIKSPQPSDIINTNTIEIDPMNPEFPQNSSIKIDVTSFINSQLANTTDQYASFIVQRDLSLAVTKDFYITFTGEGTHKPILTIERPQNTPPTLTSSSITGTEDTALSFTAQAFTDAYSDAEANPLAKIQITSLPSSETGKLKLNGTDIILNQEIPLSELSNIQFIPVADFFGTASFTWTASDGTEYSSNSSTMLITITGVNDAPLIGMIAPQETDEDTAITIPISVTDIDTSIEQMNFTLSSSNETIVANNQITVNKSDQTVSITPVADRYGVVVITISISDGDSVAYTTFSLTINAVNDAPKASNDTFSVDEDSYYSGVLYGSDVENDSLTYHIVSSSTKGSIILNKNTGVYTYSPNPNENGFDSFTYNVYDGLLYSSTHTISITINPINDAPTLAGIDDHTTDEDVPLTIIFAASDIDNPISQLTFEASSSNTELIPDANIVIDPASLQITITPAQDKYGTADITLVVKDLEDLYATTTFTVTVDAVNDSPIAKDASITLMEDDTFTGTLLGEDVEGDDLTYILQDMPSKGIVELTNDTLGQYTYTPYANEYGNDSFTFILFDGVDYSVAATISITIVSVNDAPTLDDIDNQETDEDTELTVSFNATDVETALADLAITATSSDDTLIAMSSIVVDQTTKTLTLTPATNASGTATITVTVTDEEQAAVTKSFTLTVHPVNDLPELAPIAAQVTDEDTPLTVSYVVTDVESAREDLVITVLSSNEALVATSDINIDTVNQQLVLSPATDANGTTDITVTVTDEDNGVAQQTFTLTVNAVNDAPILAAIDNQVTDEDTELTVPFAASDVETALEDLTITVSSSNEALIVSNDIVIDVIQKALIFTPVANASGTATMTLTIEDEDGDTAVQAFTVTVNAVNDAPVLAPIADQVMDEDTAIEVNYTASDVETALANLVVTVASSDDALIATSSIIVDKVQQTITLTPATDASGTVAITLTVEDEDGESAVQTFTITVNAVNDIPVLAPIADQVTDEDTEFTVAYVASDVETATEELVITVASSDETLIVASDVVIDTENEQLIFTPVANASGTAVITVTVEDEEGDTVDQTFTVTVNAVNDAPTLDNIDNQETDEDIALTVPFNATDVETASADLAITATSSDEAVIATSSIVVDKVAKTLTLTPAANASGTATITVTVTDEDHATVTKSFTLTVHPVNDEPVLLPIADQITNEDTPLTVSYVVTDVESAREDLSVTVSSSNEALVATSDINIDTVKQQFVLTPAADANGTTDITVTVTDEDNGVVQQTFTLTVNAVNDAPVLAAIDNQVTDEDTELIVPFAASDVETALEDLTITVSSSNEALIVSSDIVIDVVQKALIFTPVANASGTATITLTIEDEDGVTAVQAFTVTVNAVNDEPVLAPIADQVTDEDTAIEVNYTVSDVETALANLIVTAASSEGALIATSSIVIDKAQQTITLTPVADGYGEAIITVTVTDEAGGTTVHSFTVTVNAVNDAPTLVDIANQVTEEDTELTVAIVASDVETAITDLIVTVVSSDEALIATSSIVVDKAAQTLTLTPVANAYGTATVTVTVTDEEDEAVTKSFTLTVNAVNDAPELGTIAKQITDENSELTVSFTVNDLETALADLNISVASSNEALIAASDIVVNTTSQALTLKPVRHASGKTTITLTVTDEEGLSSSTAFEVEVKAAPTTPTVPNIPSPVVEEQTSISIGLDEQLHQNYAKVSRQQAGGRSSAIVELETENVLAAIAEGKQKTLSLSIMERLSNVQLNIDGDILDAIKQNQGAILLNTIHGSYTLDLNYLNLASELPDSIDLKDVYISLEVSEAEEKALKQMTDVVEKNGYELVSTIVNYTVRLHYNDTSIELNRFTNYMQRKIPLDEDIDPSKITTGIVFDANGEVHHVPTTVMVENSQYYAQINAMSNSYYGVVWSPKAFSDVEQHWSKEDVNDMASRLIINGMTESIFDPDNSITRAQFAAIITRGLGLIYEKQQAENKMTFHDVITNSWYEDAVQIASSYELITGYEDGSFKPNQTISRMEAMVMIARAMRLANLNTELDEQEVEKLLQRFSDQDKLSKWAYDGTALNIKYGIIDEQAQSLKPLVNITRAETASMFRKVLQKAELIN